jgi:hypothetical protein
VRRADAAISPVLLATRQRSRGAAQETCDAGKSRRTSCVRIVRTTWLAHPTAEWPNFSNDRRLVAGRLEGSYPWSYPSGCDAASTFLAVIGRSKTNRSDAVDATSMVAPNYRAQRSALAKGMGLGQKRGYGDTLLESTPDDDRVPEIARGVVWTAPLVKGFFEVL